LNHLKKKIAIIIPGGIGGGNFLQGIPVVEDLVQRLSESYEVTVYSLIKTDPAYTPKNFVLRHTGAHYKRPVMWRIFLCSLLFVFDYVKNRYVLVHGIWGHPPGRMAVILAKIFGIPSVVSIRGGEAAHVPEINYGNMLHPRIRKITLWTCRNAAALVMLTRFQLTELRKYGMDRKDYHIIPNGVDETVFTFQKKALRAPYHLIHIGNLNPVKDQPTLLKAFKLISEKVDCRLKMVGDGESMHELKQLAENLGIADKVTFTDAIPNKALPGYLHEAHFMLHSSLYEGQGVVLAEAAACGVVVCATRVGLVADWGDNCCRPVPCRDFQAMANEVLSLIENPPEYERLQQNALNWAKENTAANMALSFEKIYNSLLK